jgi:hypothetical protein
MFMKTAQYLITEYPFRSQDEVLDCKEKNFKLCVSKCYQDSKLTTFIYTFYHVDKTSRLISQDDYQLLLLKNKSLFEESISAAEWYISQYQKHRQFNYKFTFLGYEVGGYYKELLEQEAKVCTCGSKKGA